MPVWAVLISIAGSLLALLSSVYAASTVYLALVSISGLATILVWISIAVCQILFRRRLIASGKDPSDSSALAYRTAGYPFNSPTGHPHVPGSLGPGRP